DEQPLTEEEYNKFSFSVTSNNVAIQSISYSNGSINLKLKIIDLSQVGDDGISTSLNYTYTDEFNNNQGSFPIKVMPASSIVGNWKIVSTTADTLDNCRIMNNLYTYRSNGTYENELYKLTNGDCLLEGIYTGTYQVSGNTLITTGVFGGESEILLLDAN